MKHRSTKPQIARKRKITSLETIQSFPLAIPCSTKDLAAYPAAFPPPTMTNLQQQVIRNKNNTHSDSHINSKQDSLAILIGKRGRSYNIASPSGWQRGETIGARNTIGRNRLRAPEWKAVLYWQRIRHDFSNCKWIYV